MQTPEAQILVRTLQYADKQGTPSALFLAYHLISHPDYKDEIRYTDFWIRGDDFKNLPVNEPDRENEIQIIIKRELERAFLEWDNELNSRPKEMTDELAGKSKPAPISIDLKAIKEKAAKNKKALDLANNP